MKKTKSRISKECFSKTKEKLKKEDIQREEERKLFTRPWRG